ncbi:MAG: PAS domain S-box protein [Bacteroidota bacterium]|nr:PAS domain S-box protein [Bacteroidota bacterium]
MTSLNKNKGFISKIVGIIIIVAGCLFLTESLFNIFFFKQSPSNNTVLGVATSFCFLLSGISLFFLDSKIKSQSQKAIVVICAGVILLTGIWNLSEYLFNFNFVRNVRFSKDFRPIAAVFFERMSLVISINFTLLGIIFLLLSKKNFHWSIQILLIALIPGSVLAILIYFFGMTFLDNVLELNKAPFSAAILFIITITGVFFSSTFGYARLPFINKIAGFFILVLLTRSIIFFAINKNNEQADVTYKQVEQTHEVLLVSEKINASSAELQNTTMAFLISADENLALLFKKDENILKNLFVSLATLKKNGNDRQSFIDTLGKQVTSYIFFQNRRLDIRKTKGFDEKQIIALNSQSEALRAKVVASLNSIEQEQNHFLLERKNKSNLTVINSSKLLTLLQFVLLFLMIIALRIIYRNVKFRNQIESDLKNSLKDVSDYKHALDASSIVVITDENGIIKEVNNNFCKVSKYNGEELTGKRYPFAISEFHTDEFNRELWDTIRSGSVWRGEIKNKAKDQSYFWLDTTIVPFLDDEGKPYQYVAVRSDITQRKELEEKIRQINEGLQKSVEDKTAEVIEKEQQYRFLLQNMREGIQVIGYDWRYRFVNDSVVHQSKYSNEELLGRTMMEMFPEIENTALFKILQKCMTARNAQIAENEFTLLDGKRGCLELSIQPVPEGLLIISMDITERKKAAQDLIEERLKQQELITETTIRTQREEKNKLGRELHDNINQILATVKIYLGLAKSGQNVEEDLVGKSYDYVIEAMKAIRKLSHSLAAPSLEESNLKEALHRLIEDINVLNDLKIQLLIEENCFEINKDKELTLYRIVQEQLSNIIKYANAKTVIIQVKIVDDNLLLSVVDDGVGFDTLKKSAGIGLHNIRSRIEFYGGKMIIASSPGKGCAVEVALPHLVSK